MPIIGLKTNEYMIIYGLKTNKFIYIYGFQTINITIRAKLCMIWMCRSFLQARSVV